MSTASQGGICALVWAKCYVFLSDVHHNVSQVLRALASEARAIERLIGNPLQEWWASLITEWQWVLAVLGGSTCVLVSYCCSLYCCCGLWVQGSALLIKGHSQKISSHRLYSEEPEGVDCRVNRGSLASSPRCLGN